MATVLIQIGLSGGRPRDYDYLTQFMERSGWQSQITGADGIPHALTPGTYIGEYHDPAGLASQLRQQISDSRIDTNPRILTAFVQGWTLLG